MTPSLDFLTLLVMVATNLVAISVALPLIMGRGISAAARSVQIYMLLQALAWITIIASTQFLGTLADRVLSSLSIACGTAAQWLLFRALSGWLGQRRGGALVALLAVAAPLGYFLGFAHYAFRVGWANTLLAALLLVVASACMQPKRDATRGWRWLLGACLVAMAVLLLARGYLGAFTSVYPSFRTPHPVNMAFAITSNVTVVLSVIALLVPWRDEAEQRLRSLALTDALTGLPNRRGFDQRAAAMLAHAQRHQLRLTALMLDIDLFKDVNDQHGHEAGDRALALFARLLAQSCRGNDLAARGGGEEFCVLLDDAGPDAVQQFDLRLRSRLYESALPELGFALDFSAGAAYLAGYDDGIEPLLARADAAMYRAKQAGRGHLVSDAAGEPTWV